MTRDVVGHLVEWLPQFFFEQWDLEPGGRPTVEEDPVKAWAAVDAVIQAALDDPAQATAVQDTRMGPQSFEQCFDMIGTNDVFMHTWDISRAAGLDETLDPVEVHDLFWGWSRWTRCSAIPVSTVRGCRCRMTPTSRRS